LGTGRAITFTNRYRLAFTIIELLLVVSLMVVMAGLSLPNLPRYFSSVKLDQTARHLSHLMRYGQSLAVIHQKEYRLHLSLSELKYWLEEEVLEDAREHKKGADEEKDFQRMAGEKGRIFSIPTGLTIEAEDPDIDLYPDSSMDRAQIVMYGKNNKKMVVSTQQKRGQVDVFWLDQ